jgi:hypothetical protein
VIPSIKTPRLELVSLSPEFLRASLAGQPADLGAELPSDWPKGHAPLLQRRLTQLEANPSDLPWLLRAILLPREKEEPLSSEFGPAPTEGQRDGEGKKGTPFRRCRSGLREGEKEPLSGGGGPALAKVPRLIGLIGSHAPPDPTGMLEIGYRIEAP